MNRVYEDDLGGSYCKEANELEEKIRMAIRHIIRYEVENGSPSEAIEYVCNSAVHTEILAQKNFVRRGKDCNGR